MINSGPCPSYHLARRVAPASSQLTYVYKGPCRALARNQSEFHIVGPHESKPAGIDCGTGPRDHGLPGAERRKDEGQVFVGRWGLRSLIEQLIGNHSAESDRLGTRPIVVVEGIGGSGRSEVLREIRDSWTKYTPTVLVSSLARPDTDRGVRPVLAAVVLGLSGSGPRFKISFPRVMLGQIAVQGPALPTELPAAINKMNERLEEKLRKESLERFIEDITKVVEALLADMVPLAGMAPGAKTAQVMGSIVAERLTSRLRRNPLRSRLWREAARWYVESQPAMANYLEALVRLNWTAHESGAAALDSVDDKLMNALLADLRSSFAGIKVRKADAVVLLDDGDTPAAKKFTESFLRVKRMAGPRSTESPEPLTLVTVSGGGLLRDIGLDAAEVKVMTERQISDDIRISELRDRRILRIPSAGLFVSEVQELAAKSFKWPTGSSEDAVSAMVCKLTDGHPFATDLLLRELAYRPDLINDLDAVLRGNRLNGTSPERQILELIVKAFSPHGIYHSRLHEILVTFAAGRDQSEAEILCSSPLFHPNDTDKDMLLGLSTLWTHPGHNKPRRMHPLVRNLCLRFLARRDRHHRASWRRTFNELRDAADRAGDVEGRMHHDLMLVADELGTEPVATELTEQLPSRPTEEWCHRLDLVIATPNPYRIDRANELVGEIPATEESQPGSVARVLGIENALTDPCLTDRRTRGALHSLAAADYLKLADQARNRLIMIRRSDRHRAEAKKLQ